MLVISNGFSLLNRFTKNRYTKMIMENPLFQQIKLDIELVTSVCINHQCLCKIYRQHRHPVFFFKTEIYIITFKIKTIWIRTLTIQKI